MMSGDRYTFCSSKIVLILHTPCSHFGPYIFRKIFLSHVIRLDAIFPVIAQVSLPYNSTGLIIVLYIFILVLLCTGKCSMHSQETAPQLPFYTLTF
jgi:hypothetical protein